MDVFIHAIKIKERKYKLTIHLKKGLKGVIALKATIFL